MKKVIPESGLGTSTCGDEGQCLKLFGLICPGYVEGECLFRSNDLSAKARMLGYKLKDLGTQSNGDEHFLLYIEGEKPVHHVCADKRKLLAILQEEEEHRLL